MACTVAVVDLLNRGEEVLGKLGYWHLRCSTLLTVPRLWQQNLGIGQYTRPGDDPVDMYATVTSKQLERGSQPIEYAVPPNQTIPGYQGCV